jgi:hypothetical protein
MKRYAITVLAVSAFFLIGAGFALAQSTSPETVLSQIRQKLGLGPDDRIDPSKVPDNLMQELGDAVMDQMIPNPQQHEWMDRMMGGEGSESLAAAHRWMGYRYLTGGYGPGGGYGMMGGGMMGGGYGGWGMMGNPNLSYNAIPDRSPERIVKQRYARGQITRDQYERIMKDLQQPPNGG